MPSGNKANYLVIAGAIFLVISLVFFLIASTKKTTAEGESLKECNVIQYNGEGKIGVVIFGKENEAKKYSDFFLNSYPISENKESFNIYYIDSAPECELYKGIAVFCHSKELIKQAASCPGVDLITVLEARDRNIRSSSYLNVLSVNSNDLITVFLHEFGHAFANFAEEYAPANLQRGQPNCKGSCSDFSEETDGCFKECSSSSYYRSVSSGIMRTLSPPDTSNMFGEYNSKIVSKLITERAAPSKQPGITGSQVASPRDCNKESFLLYDANSKETSIHKGCPPGTGYGSYSYKILDKDGKELISESFSADIYTDGQQAEKTELNGEIFSGQDNIILSLPQNPESYSIIVSDQDSNTISQSNIYGAGATACPI